MRTALVVVAAAAAAAAVYAQRTYGSGPSWWNGGQGGFLGWDQAYDNAEGQVTVVNKNGSIRTDGHPFFEPLGSNGRACITCHQPASAMSVSAASLRQRWNETGGKDPVFAAIDGSNCPDLPQSELRSHSLLVERGLFRIALAWPPKNVRPEFRLEVVRDPTGCNSMRDGTVSVYRRPRIAANLDGLVTIMSDGREGSLASQAISAIMGHEQAEKHPTLEQLQRIVAFETQVFAAQSADIRGGLLTEKGGPPVLGPENLAAGNATSLGTRLSFDMWLRPPDAPSAGLQTEFRASVARGSDVFFSRGFEMHHVGVKYVCATCHAKGFPMADVGTTNRRTPDEAPADLPLFRITCDEEAAPHPQLGRVFYTQDPGRALISGKCRDVGSIARQQLRGLAARAPYFANGSARTLDEVVEFYDRRFQIKYTSQERQDLLNFLRVL